MQIDFYLLDGVLLTFSFVFFHSAIDLYDSKSRDVINGKSLQMLNEIGLDKFSSEIRKLLSSTTKMKRDNLLELQAVLPVLKLLIKKSLEISLSANPELVLDMRILKLAELLVIDEDVVDAVDTWASSQDIDESAFSSDNEEEFATKAEEIVKKSRLL